MNSQDPIADMLTQIRNGQMVKKERIYVPASTKKAAILKVLTEEGYILGFNKADTEKPSLEVYLKYFNNKPVISLIKRVSRPGLRVYKGKEELPKVMGGLGVAIVSTSHGIVTDKKARQLGQGGEVLCFVA